MADEDYRTLFARHSLRDNKSPYARRLEVVFECDSSWASIAVKNKQGQIIGDVTIELYGSKIVARIWNKEDSGGDPTAKVEICELKDLQDHVLFEEHEQPPSRPGDWIGSAQFRWVTGPEYDSF